MKNEKIISKCLIAAFAISLTIVGCKKDDVTTEPTTTTTATELETQQSVNDNEEGDFVSSDVTNMADQVENGENSFKMNDALYSPCATIVTKSNNTSVTPRELDSLTITIDFGTTACECKDYRFRKGKIIITRKGKFYTAGSYRTVTFQDYSVGKSDSTMHKIEGTHTVTYNGKNANQHYNWTVKAENMKITGSQGKSHSWNSTRTREWIKGDTTLLHWKDDVFSITGSTNGTNAKGTTYSALITKALVRDMSCTKQFRFVSGTVEVTRGDKKGTIDYGDGTCDGKVTVTVNGKTSTITMH